MKNAMAFVTWLLKRWTSGFVEIYNAYAEFVMKEAIAIMPTILVSIVGVAVISITILPAMGLVWWSWSTVAFLSVWWGNYVRLLFKGQYRKYQAEQKQMIDILKS